MVRPHPPSMSHFLWEGGHIQSHLESGMAPGQDVLQGEAGAAVDGIAICLKQSGQVLWPPALLNLLKRPQERPQRLVEPLTGPIALWVVGGSADFRAPVKLTEWRYQGGFKGHPSCCTNELHKALTTVSADWSRTAQPYFENRSVRTSTLWVPKRNGELGYRLSSTGPHQCTVGQLHCGGSGGVRPAGGAAGAGWAAEHGCPGAGPIGGYLWSPCAPGGGPLSLLPVPPGLGVPGGVPTTVAGGACEVVGLGARGCRAGCILCDQFLLGLRGGPVKQELQQQVRYVDWLPLSQRWAKRPENWSSGGMRGQHVLCLAPIHLDCRRFQHWFRTWSGGRSRCGQSCGRSSRTIPGEDPHCRDSAAAVPGPTPPVSGWGSAAGAGSGRFQWDAAGQPVCANCMQAGHMQPA